MVISRLLIVAAATLFLLGCNHNKCKECTPVTVVKVQEVEKPVAVCPSELQNIQHPTRPTLYIDLLTEEDAKNNPGRVAQYYKFSIKQLMDYAKDLENNTTLYKKTCDGLPSSILKTTPQQ